MYNDLLDPNMDKKIKSCFIDDGRHYTKKIFVVYEDETREYIWTYNPRDVEFNYRDFIGMTKIEAAFYCDRKTNGLLEKV
jgi:hypothetical protein